MIRLACERPADSEVPLARWSSSELAAEVVTRGICEQISGITVWRWLSEDAIKPWQYRSWIFPRDPHFTEKAGRILDLYAGRWEGELLHPGDYVVCCDEKPSIQARQRRHATLPANPGVTRGQDNGSAHRGKKSIKRLQGRYKNLILVHTPVHASWLNQAEVYFSIVQRKVLTSNDFSDLAHLEEQLLAFGRRYEQIAQPFEWKFTRADLRRLAERLELPTSQAA